MVATQAAAGAAVAIATYVGARRLPPITKDQRTNAAIQAAVGLGLALASMKVANGWAKTAMVGAGVGLLGRAASDTIPALN